MSSLDRDTAYDPSTIPFEPSGIAGTIEYNGLVFNDRRFADRIIVNQITGIDDPDVRDSRDTNPDRDGETAYDSFYSGRGITLRGYIQAGNWQNLKNLWGQLKTAFDDVEDHNLIFRWQDLYETWQGNWSADYVFEAGSAPQLNAVSYPGYTGNKLSTTGTNEKRFYYKNRIYGDSECTVQFISGTSSFGTTTLVGPWFKRIDSTNFILVEVLNGNLRIISINSSVGTTTLASTAVTTAANTTYWIRSRIEGNIVTAELWTTVAPSDSGTPAATTSTTLAGSDLTKFGTGTTGFSGIEFVPQDTTCFLGQPEFAALNAGDSMISCRKNAKIESDDVIDDKGDYKKQFLISLRSSSAPFVSHKLMKYSFPVTVASLVFPGGGGGFTFPLDGSGLVFGAIVGSTSNLGRSVAYPIIRLYGLAVNPGIANAANNQALILDGTVISGDYIEFDSEHRTIVDSSGNSIYSELDTSTIWLTMPSGANSISVGADSIDGSTKVVIYYRHSSR